MQLGPLQYIVWLGSIGLEGVVVCALVRRRLVRQVLPFFAYVAFHFFRSIVQFAVWHVWPRTYDKVYWPGEAIGFALAYLLILDFWRQGLRAYRGIWLLSRWVLGFACLGLLAVVRATTQFGQGATPQAAHWINDWMRLVDRSVLFSQAVFLLAFFLVLGFFRIRVTRLVRGLALCWFSYSLVAVSLQSLRYFYGPAIQSTYSLAFSLSFVILLGAWGAVVWTHTAEQEVELAPVFALGSSREQVMEQMELLNSSLLRIWKAART